jgi:hypothetical protein
MALLNPDYLVRKYGPKPEPAPTAPAPTAPTTSPYTLEQFSIDLNAGNITSQDDLNKIIYERGYSSGDTNIAPRTAKYAPTMLGSDSGGSRDSGVTNPLGGGSDGSNFGSAGGGYNPGGTTYQYDAAGNRVVGKLGGQNVIQGGRGIDRTAGVSNPMNAWSQYLDPNYFLGRATDIRKEVERSMQSQIDAINSRYEGQVRREEQAGQEDLARQRSMNLRAGLGGSDFGAANKAEVRNRTSANVRDIQANQDIAIGDAVMRIEQIAQNRITMEQTAMQNAFTNSMAYAEYAQAQQDRARTQTLESVARIASMNPELSVKDIAERDPQLYQNIQQNTGMSDFEIDAYLNHSNGVTTENVWKGNTMLTLRKDAQGNVLSTKTYSADELGVPQGINMQTITNSVTGETFYWDADNVEKDANGNVVMRSLGKTQLTAWDEAAIARQNAAFEAGLEEEAGGTGTSELMSNIQLTNDIINSPEFNAVFGLKNPLTYYTPGSAEQYAKAQVDQLISLLSLDSREKLKGSGAISDFESRTLAKSASALSPSLSEVDAKKELSKIRGVFTTAAGGAATIKVTDPQTGESKTMQSTRAQIDAAIADGLNVEYL